MAAQKNDVRTLVFYDPSMPHTCDLALVSELVPEPFEAVTSAHLARKLTEGYYTLVSLHGPYFPKSAWPAILHFLEGGGNCAILGGMPFSRPVTAAGTVEPEQDSYTRQLFLGPIFPIVTKEEVTLQAAEGAELLKSCALSIPPQPLGMFWSCYPKLTQVSDHPEDLGSAGPLDTLLVPLVYAVANGRKVATPAFLLEQRSGRFKGGRWLILAWQPASDEVWRANAQAIRNMIALASEGVITCDVRPVLACYQSGERPTLRVAVRSAYDLHVDIACYAPDSDSILQQQTLHFPASPVLQEERISLPIQQQPGLYRVVSSYYTQEGQQLTQETGVWLWDNALVQATRGKRLTAGRDYFYQSDTLFPLFGTTYMDSVVQRKFLHLPNPARWERDIVEMKEAGINTLRTGLWSAWREFVPLAGMANEAFLRALDAFVMTVCKHDMQLIFNFFAFYPPLFEGENPWLDPRSVEAQQDFVALVAHRYALVELLSWDLINEPSFGDPTKIFAQRPIPNYDRFELRAFQEWLKKRTTLEELQLRWRKTPAELPSWEHVHPPATSDYGTHVRDNNMHYMFQVADYTHFSQDMFRQWAARMYQAIRAAGSQTLVGVGQDEAGVRLAPQFYADAVDYTTTHPWWNNDALLWDMLLDKTPHKPNIIQETGVMLVRDVDGRPWRSEQANADLLERKLITGLAARGAGLIQWLWHTNSYMTSDNENSIGLVRTDGSEKPELGVMRAFGRLMQVLNTSIVEPEQLPAVWVVVPYGQWFVRPELAIEATQQAVRALGYHLGIVPQLVGEQRLQQALTSLGTAPRALILPSVQMLEAETWKTLQKYVFEGGTLLVSGVITHSSYNLSHAPMLTEMGETERVEPVSRYERLEMSPGQHVSLLYDGEKIGYLKKANNSVHVYRHGSGSIVWSGLPLECCSDTSTIAMFYQRYLGQQALIQAVKERAEQAFSGQPLLIVERQLSNGGSMIVCVSELGYAREVTLENGLRVEVAANRAGAIVLQGKSVVHVFGGVVVRA